MDKKMSTRIHQKCPLEFAHFEKNCPREFTVHENSPSHLKIISFPWNTDATVLICWMYIILPWQPDMQMPYNTATKKKLGFI